MELGAIAHKTADYNAAASNWEQASKIQPDSLLALANLGAVYHMLGRDDDAATALQRALEIKPDASTYSNLGTVRFYQGHYDDSVAAFEKAVELSANDYEMWGNLGDAYRWSSTQKVKAKPAYQQAIQLVGEEINKHPDRMGLRTDLALYLAKSGDKQSALRQLKPVEQALNKDPSTMYYSAMVYEICGDARKCAALALGSGQSGPEPRRNQD